MKAHFVHFAYYNKWANTRLYEAALAIDDVAYRQDVGAFFKSLHGTLNHLLLTDRIWMKRLTGEGSHPDRLDATIHDDRLQLALARADEDERIVRYVDSLDETAISAAVEYSTTSGRPFKQAQSEVLAHLFNHQTHHRGQAHAIISICTGSEPPQLDLLAMQRGVQAPDLRALASSEIR